MFNKILMALVICSLCLGGFNTFKENKINDKIVALADDLKFTSELALSTKKELDTDIKPAQANMTASLLRLHGQVESFDLYANHERKRRIRIFQVREAIKHTIMQNQHSSYFQDTKRLSDEELYKMSTYIVDSCERYDVPVFLFMGLLRQESAFNPTAISPTGAQGLSQIVPSTAKHIARELKVDKYDTFNMEHNIRFGAYYLSKMLERFSDDSSLALQAYNAGPEAVSNYLSKKVRRLPNETIQYEKRIQAYATEYANLGLH